MALPAPMALPALRKRPKLLLMGPRSGGKSSIKKVVFERLAPNDTLFIEKTTKTSVEDLNAFVVIDSWDLPGGQLDPDSWKIHFDQLDAVIFVLDAQSTFHDMIRKLAITMHKAFTAHPGIQFEIFLHKIDGMSEDYRLDTLQNLRDRLTEDLFDLSSTLESSMNVTYHLTSVFDTSIYEALSKVIQKLLPEQGTLERLLDMLCQQCSIEKAFLFDTSSKIYIATDSSPLDNQTYVICSDYIDLIGDFTLLYEPTSSTYPTPHPRSLSIGSRTPSTTLAMAKPEAPLIKSPDLSKPFDESSSSVRLASSRVKLGTGGTIAQWAINPDLSLVAILRPNVIDLHGSLIDYNVSVFRDAVLQLFELNLV